MNLSPAPVREDMYRDGKMTTPWVRWFDAVYSRVGGTSDPLTTEIENRASDDQPIIVVEEHSHFEEADIGAAIQASLDLAPVKSVFGRSGIVTSAEGDYSLTQLGDVTLSSPTTKQALAFNGSLWSNADIVNSATGTANQISITSGTGDITFSLPDNMTIGGSTGVINISSTVASTSTTSGALKVAGGAGVAGSLFSLLMRTSSSQASTSRTSGSIVSAGGIGANGQITATAFAGYGPLTKSAAYTMAATDCTIIFNGSASITLTLLSAATYTGRFVFLKNTAAFTVVSASSNVIPITGGAAGTAILPAVAGSWCVLQSDGSVWHTIAS